MPDESAFSDQASIETIWRFLFYLLFLFLKTEIPGEIISPQLDNTDLKECLKRYRDATYTHFLTRGGSKVTQIDQREFS